LVAGNEKLMKAFSGFKGQVNWERKTGELHGNFHDLVLS